MEITLFAKARTTKDGKPFHTYITSLKKKDGTTVVAAVKFNRSCDRLPKPEDCPMNIIVAKEDAQLSSKEFINEDTGEVFTGYSLWVRHWADGTEYVDHSLDDFED